MLPVVIEMESRWRVGTGGPRPGAVDDETWADADGQVLVPASHLKRRLRERAEELVDLLGGRRCDGRLAAARQEPEVGPLDVGRVFGSPRVEPEWRFGPAIMDLPARTDDELRVLREAARRPIAHNAVDPWSRRVGEDLLFTLEAGRAGTRLRAGIVRWDDGGDGIEAEVALLVGTVGALESLGPRRRRGYGRCRAWLDGAVGGRDHDTWVDLLVARPELLR
ncbi:MAG: hypothetical protein E6J41_26495 [Chloroflexi bacterium]|nr:MAG: hypothetical protein E6J41_26495 [Chloroflexota bacterium]